MKHGLMVLALSWAVVACGDEAGDGDESGAGGGGGTPVDAGLPQDMRPRLDIAPIQRDMRPRPDQRVRPADMGLDLDMHMGPLPDVGPLDGEECDPRLRAVACDPGAFCVHVPGRPANQGRCQLGDGCRIATPGDCPADKPYCHLKGAATVCTTPGELLEGEECLNDLDIPQPCAEGLVCNNAICQKPCIPGMENDCPDEGRCADISAAIAVEGGLCAPRGCSWFSGEPCPADKKCGYAIRGGSTLVGSCVPSGNNQEGSPCTFADGGGDNCGQGMLCVGPPDREKFCRILCDTGAYEAPCPNNMACRNVLATTTGRVHSYGICYTNQ